MNGYPWTGVTAEMEVEAKRERERRDREGTANRMPVDPDKDNRWHGHLGEAVFAKWLAHNHFAYRMNGGKDRLPDFVVGRWRIALKTRCEAGLPGGAWDHESHLRVSVKHQRDEVIDLCAFALFMRPERRVYIVGYRPRVEVPEFSTLLDDKYPVYILPAGRTYSTRRLGWILTSREPRTSNAPAVAGAR